MPKINGILLYQKLKNIDPNLLFCFITANKECVENIKKNNSDIEKIVIYKPILLSKLRDKIHILLANEQHDKKQLLMI
jgi:two-component SAPR family response regulator